ncbi:hypothetical protein ACPOL_1434 [Acidisarcina polymorpha]|uniref:Uncharacterized protein n=1 Tax=Acidisarcina polymorpha TaxID=2211140 RepID=A0A2Z5FVL0_9BACT|nr:hypothetical protein [Acidisarcina polymorpha]AXC10780.1 hypothetical protein ACPOL_1434 [Acidisarcina polymorpha]
MFAKCHRYLLVLFAVCLVGSGLAWSQAALVLHAPEAAKVLPESVFFRGQSAPLQLRNSAGIKFDDGMFVLAALVDTSGYSTSVQQKYQAYFITEAAIEINGHSLAPGAYGVGFVGGHFGLMDIGNHDLFSVDSTRDTELKRPTPLQMIAEETTPGRYRLYEGRDYVVISRPASSK